MTKSPTLLLLLLLSQFCLAQITGAIPSSSSIANTSTSDSHHWTAFHNPAILGKIEKSELAVLYENRFQLSELSTKTIQAAYSNNLINTGISLSQFGYSHYQEFMLGIGWGRNFSNKFSMGVQFNYFTNYFEASNTYRAALIAQFGLLMQLSPNFNLGFSSFNPFQSNIKAEFVVQKIPSIFSYGAEYFFCPELVWRSQLDKEVSSNYRIASGFEYTMLQLVVVKLGAYQSDFLVPCLGLGLSTSAFVLSFNTEMHPLLGLRSNIGMRYQIHN